MSGRAWRVLRDNNVELILQRKRLAKELLLPVRVKKKLDIFSRPKR